MTGKSTPTSLLKAWARLLRLPNWLTVPGDPVAGYMLAAASTQWDSTAVILTALSVLSLYLFGLSTNDLADFEEDEDLHRDRPLPNGDLSKPAVWTFTVISAVLGVSLAFSVSLLTGLIACLLLASILGYNVILKNIPFVGAMTMGCCRALSVIMGITAAQSPVGNTAAYCFVGSFILYVAALTYIAYHEALPRHISSESWLPSAGIIAVYVITGLGAEAVASSPVRHFTAWMGLAFMIALFAGLRLARASSQTDQRDEFRRREDLMRALPRTVGLLISNILFLQCAAVALSGHMHQWTLLIILTLCWPVHRFLCRWFYSS